MKKFLLTCIFVLNIAIVAISFIGLIIVQFKPLPNGISKIMADFYILTHYWYYVVGIFGGIIAVAYSYYVLKEVK